MQRSSFSFFRGEGINMILEQNVAKIYIKPE